MIGHEERNSRVCVGVSKLHTSKISIQKACGFALKNCNSGIKVGNDSHGLRNWSSQDFGEV